MAITDNGLLDTEFPIDPVAPEPLIDPIATTDTIAQVDSATPVAQVATTAPIAPQVVPRETFEVDAQTETVAGQMEGLLSEESPYIDRARASSAEAANARGLQNSSIAAGAGEAAAIDAALPIAMQDAATYYQTASREQDFQNDSALQSLREAGSNYRAELSNEYNFANLAQEDRAAMTNLMSKTMDTYEQRYLEIMTDPSLDEAGKNAALDFLDRNVRSVMDSGAALTGIEIDMGTLNLPGLPAQETEVTDADYTSAVTDTLNHLSSISETDMTSLGDELKRLSESDPEVASEIAAATGKTVEEFSAMPSYDLGISIEDAIAAAKAKGLSAAASTGIGTANVGLAAMAGIVGAIAGFFGSLGIQSLQNAAHYARSYAVNLGYGGVESSPDNTGENDENSGTTSGVAESQSDAQAEENEQNSGDDGTGNENGESTGAGGDAGVEGAQDSGDHY